MTAKLANPLRWTCEECGVKFARVKEGDRVFRLCTQKCFHAWNRRQPTAGGRIKPGTAPWNKGVKGLQHSPATQWKKGCASNRKLPVGSITVRTRKRDGTPRAFIKVAEPNSWRPNAVVVWEAANGPVPRGMIIHHRDHNSLNDDLKNLQAMTRAEHRQEHAEELYNALWGR